MLRNKNKKEFYFFVKAIVEKLLYECCTAVSHNLFKNSNIICIYLINRIKIDPFKKHDFVVVYAFSDLWADICIFIQKIPFKIFITMYVTHFLQIVK